MYGLDPTSNLCIVWTYHCVISPHVLSLLQRLGHYFLSNGPVFMSCEARLNDWIGLYSQCSTRQVVQIGLVTPPVNFSKLNRPVVTFGFHYVDFMNLQYSHIIMALFLNDNFQKFDPISTYWNRYLLSGGPIFW